MQLDIMRNNVGGYTNMMNLALNISLTDEQYTDLMSKTYEKLFESDDFIKELSNVILTQIGQYLKDNPSEIREALGISVPHYNRTAVQSENRTLVSKVITKASEEYSAEISDNVKIALQNILKVTNFSDIIESVLAKAILRGMGSGLEDYLSCITMHVDCVNNEVSNLKDRLCIGQTW